MRGKEKSLRMAKGVSGIIPAGAGKRDMEELNRYTLRDHPRGCGEKKGAAFDTDALRGSSPRVRGKGVESRPLPPRRRIIPAGAGKSCFNPETAAITEDHPRGCGEKIIKASLRRAGKGSSPRVRGKGSRRRDAPTGSGIIPAGAGKR